MDSDTLVDIPQNYSSLPKHTVQLEITKQTCCTSEKDRTSEIYAVLLARLADWKAPSLANVTVTSAETIISELLNKHNGVLRQRQALLPKDEVYNKLRQKPSGWTIE